MKKKMRKIAFSGKFLFLWIAQMGICGIASIISSSVGAENLFLLFFTLTFGSLVFIGLGICYLE